MVPAGASAAFTFLRIKRKRGEAPLDTVAVDPAPHDAGDADARPEKRRHLADSLESSFAALSTREEQHQASRAASATPPPGQAPLIFKRVRRDGDDAPQYVASAASVLPPPPPQFLEVRRSLARPRFSAGIAGRPLSPLSGAGTLAASIAVDVFHPRYQVIDLVQLRSAAVPAAATPASACSFGTTGAAAVTSASPSSAVTVNGRPLPSGRAQRVLNPLERAMDAAVVHLFATGAMAPLEEALAMGADVNYQRACCDDTTALMAAAYRGDAATVARLLAAGANPCLVDIHGNDAGDLALSQGYTGLLALLKRAATARGKGGSGGGDDYVYDFYACSTTGNGHAGDEEAAAASGAAAASSSAGSGSMSDGAAAAAAASMPIIRLAGLSAAAVAASSASAGFALPQPDPQELLFEDGEEWSRLANGEERYGSFGGDDEDHDSNDENFYGNDYPDEDGGGDGAHDEARDVMGMGPAAADTNSRWSLEGVAGMAGMTGGGSRGGSSGYYGSTSKGGSGGLGEYPFECQELVGGASGWLAETEDFENHAGGDGDEDEEEEEAEWDGRVAFGGGKLRPSSGAAFAAGSGFGGILGGTSDWMHYGDAEEQAEWAEVDIDADGASASGGEESGEGDAAN